MQNSKSFRNKLDRAIGDNLPANLKDSISDLMDSHCSANHDAKNNSCEDVMISALQILIDASVSHFVRAAHNNASTENGTDTPTENDKQNGSCIDAIPKSCGKDYPSSDRNAGKLVVFYYFCKLIILVYIFFISFIFKSPHSYIHFTDIDIDANLDQGHGEHLTNDLADNNVINVSIPFFLLVFHFY